MKRVYYYLLAIVSICIITFIGCSKKQEAVKDPTGIIATVDGLAKNKDFIELNNVINRFDTRFLTIVYKDARLADELAKRSNELMKQLAINPDNEVYQKELADFYHFSSAEQLKEYSAKVTKSLQSLEATFHLQKNFTQTELGDLFFKARKQYAKDKMDAYNKPASSRMRVDAAVGFDFVESDLEAFYYVAFIYDELDDQSSGDCQESCCFERETCKSSAKSKYTSNLWGYILAGGSSGGALGFFGGSALPVVGNAVGSFVGGIWGSVLGVVTANEILAKDIEACNFTYRACIEKKKGN